MPRRLIAATAVATGMSVTLLGCAGSPAAPHRVASHHAVSSAAPPPAQPVTRAAARQCPTTIPRRVVGWLGASPASMVPGTSAYGNGKLVVSPLDLNGVIVASRDFVRPDGSIWWKYLWWRKIPGDLIITGRRLDGPAPPLTSYIPNGYGDVGFQASGVTFPSEGCWQITGKIDHTSLTFITLVITEAHRVVMSSSGRRSIIRPGP